MTSMCWPRRDRHFPGWLRSPLPGERGLRRADVMRLTLLRRGCVLARLVLAARGHGCHTVALTRENAELPEASIQALLLGAGEHRHGAVAAVGHEHAVMDDVREW